MKLTDENYFSVEANREYMSVSQFKEFLSCEAKALAKLNGWEDAKNDAFVLGSYVHAAIEGAEALEKFKKDNPEIFKKDGTLKADFAHADVMIQSILEDDLCKSMLEGNKETIITAELFGVKWKAKIDVISHDHGRISDLKTVKSIRDKYWKDGRPVSFVECYDYPLQMAVYSELERLYNKRFDRLEPFIVAVSKEDVPDKEVICFDDETLENELQKVQMMLPRVIAVKEGKTEPYRCEACRYCRSSKKASIVHYLNLLEA